MRRTALMAFLLPWAGWGDVVINELMYHPPGDSDDLQYLEIRNPSTDPVDLGGWSLAEGVRFEFPAATTIDPGGFLVVAGNREALQRYYGPELEPVGEFSGRLSHRGERVRLLDTSGAVADEVDYRDRDGWPRGPDGYSASLERIHPDAPGTGPSGWAGSRLMDHREAGGTPGRPNDARADGPLPWLVEWSASPRWPRPGQPVAIRARVEHAAGIRSVEVHYRRAAPGRELETEVLRLEEHAEEHAGQLPGAASDGLLRLVFRVEGRDGAVRRFPSEEEPRPAFSLYAGEVPEVSTLSQGRLIVVGEVEPAPEHYRVQTGEGRREPSRGHAAWIHHPVGEKEPRLFDFVRVTRRSGGFKLRFHADRQWREMTGVNIIADYGGFAREGFSGLPENRIMMEELMRGRLGMSLAEHLSCELYRRSGAGAPRSDFLRLDIDGEDMGLQFMVEQINRNFLRNRGKDPDGNLYKLLWFGRSLTDRHEKKTNRHLGHEDVVETIRDLQGALTWDYIRENFDVESFASYYAVCQCNSNWDGFFNNHYLFHDTEGNGKWEILAWDNDKTWGSYDSGSPDRSWYDFPLTSGMNGDRPPVRRGFGFFSGGRTPWWRPPGFFSGPLLAQPDFRGEFLTRLETICNEVFTEEAFLPVIDALEERLRPHIPRRAALRRESPDAALARFEEEMEAFRRYLKNRRAFLLRELAR